MEEVEGRRADRFPTVSSPVIGAEGKVNLHSSEKTLRSLRYPYCIWGSVLLETVH